jgi:hypothetical protein
VKSVLKLLYFERSFPEQINAKQKLFFNSKSGEKVIPSIVFYILSRNREKQLCNKAIKSHKQWWKSWWGGGSGRPHTFTEN